MSNSPEGAEVDQNYRMVQHFFSFLLFSFCGWVLFLFCCFSLTKEKLLLGQRADGCPAPGQGPSYECKTEITSEREMSKVLATALSEKGAGPSDLKFFK